MTMETLQAPDKTPGAYSRAEFSGLHAPLEKVPPSVKLRRLLREKFLLRSRHPERSYLYACGASDAMTAAIMADLGFEAVYACAEQSAAARGLYPDPGLQPCDTTAELVRELSRGIEGLRHRRFFESGGEVRGTPPIFADLGAGRAGPGAAFSLAREALRAGAAGILVADRGPEDLIAVKAAAQAAESEVVVIADAVSLESGLDAAALGVDVICPRLDGTDTGAPGRFAAEVHRAFPQQILGLDLAASLPWGESKKRGALASNRELGAMGYALQFSGMFAFRAAGMALESWLRGLLGRGLDALADLQLVEEASLDSEPGTRDPRAFAGAERWSALDRAVRAAASRRRS